VGKTREPLKRLLPFLAFPWWMGTPLSPLPNSSPQQGSSTRGRRSWEPQVSSAHMGQETRAPHSHCPALVLLAVLVFLFCSSDCFLFCGTTDCYTNQLSLKFSVGKTKELTEVNERGFKDRALGGPSLPFPSLDTRQKTVIPRKERQGDRWSPTYKFSTLGHLQ
jgi:hypothetical protein